MGKELQKLNEEISEIRKTLISKARERGQKDVDNNNLVLKNPNPNRPLFSEELLNKYGVYNKDWSDGEEVAGEER